MDTKHHEMTTEERRRARGRQSTKWPDDFVQLEGKAWRKSASDRREGLEKVCKRQKGRLGESLQATENRGKMMPRMKHPAIVKLNL